MSISERIHQISRGWVTITAVMIFTLFTALVLPRQAAQAERISGGAGSPDTSLWYTPDQLYRLAESYGEAGRAAYIHARWTFDLIFPLVYGIFLATSLSWLSARTTGEGSLWRRLNLLPVLAVLFDLLENSAATLVMLRYPAETPLIATLAPFFTLVKWVFVGGSFTALIALLGVLAYRRVTQSRHQA